MWQRNSKVSKRSKAPKFDNFCKNHDDRPQRRKQPEPAVQHYLPSFLVREHEIARANPPPDSSVWKSVVLNEIKTEPKDDKYNRNNPTYWKNNTWIGPIIMRRINNNVLNPGASSIYTTGTTEYSIDHTRWHDSIDAAFTIDENRQMVDDENEEETERIMKLLDDALMKRIEESRLYYMEEGQLDSFGKTMQYEQEYDDYLMSLEEGSEEEEEDELIEEDVY